jgi:hypothetical protein
MPEQYEVLSPWADIDPLPLRAISPRLDALDGKRIGLFANSKDVARPILKVVEQRLKENFPTAEISWYVPAQKYTYNIVQIERPENKEVFEAWLKSVDAVIAAAGD